MKKLISVMTITAILCANTIQLNANSISEIRRKTEEVKQNINILNQQLEQLNKDAEKTETDLHIVEVERDDIMNEIYRLDMNIITVENRLEELDTQLDETQEKLTISEEELEQAQTEKDHQYQTTKKRIKYMHENGSIGYLDVLLNFNNFSDLLTRIDNINNIITYDNEVLEKMKLTEENIALKILEIETEKKTIEALTQEQENNKHSLEESKNQKKQVQAKLEEDIKEYEKRLEQMEKDDKEITAIIQSAEEEAKKLAAEEARLIAEEEARKREEARKKAEEARRKAALEEAKRNAQSSNSNNTPVYTGGTLGWPLPGYYVGQGDSGYGSRISPITGKQEVHRGIDVPAPRGTKVLAAESGTVITAKYLNSYGYAVIIDHGNGLSTVYAHNSKLLVTEGQTVSRGQAISQVGSTGDSTGNHLHFEVRVNGNYTNPFPYLN